MTSNNCNDLDKGPVSKYSPTGGKALRCDFRVDMIFSLTKGEVSSSW